MENKVIEYHFETAEDCINAILLRTKTKDEVLKYFDPNYFVFRGESSAKPHFKLIPSALRKNNILYPNYEVGSAQATSSSIIREFLALYEFYKVADKNGYALPDVQILRIFDDLSGTAEGFQLINGLKEWIPDDLLEIAGIAQHYGIPTRLLDWTFNPLTAFYFAAMGAVDELYNHLLKEYKEALHKGKVNTYATDDKIVIWALNQSVLSGTDRLRLEIPLIPVKPPYNRNPNLAAQNGLFTHWKVQTPSNKPDEYPPYDAIPLDDRLRACNYIGYVGLLYKFTMPISESNRVLSILNVLNHGVSKIFPGLNGVARESMATLKQNVLLNIWRK